MQVGFVTCRVLPEPDHDEALLAEACREAGYDARLIPWDDPQASTDDFDLVVFRSCWNYHLHAREFLQWVDRVSQTSRILNPPDIVRWNSHKTYLNDLANRGCPVVPTVHLQAGEPVDLNPLLLERDWSTVVVKPSVSAASYLTRSFGPGQEAAAQSYLSELLADRDVMVQPYLPSVDTVGERSVVWISGEASHVALKRPRFDEDEESIAGGDTPTRDECELIDRAIAPFRDRLLYARLDLMQDQNGQWLVSELELIEPSLYFPLCPEAARRFVDGFAQSADWS